MMKISKRFSRAAGDNGKILEINGQPRRLDLRDQHIIGARGYRIKFSVGTNSHASEHLGFMEFGVLQARRGWLEKKTWSISLRYPS